MRFIIRTRQGANATRDAINILQWMHAVCVYVLGFTFIFFLMFMSSQSVAGTCDPCFCKSSNRGCCCKSITCFRSPFGQHKERGWRSPCKAFIKLWVQIKCPRYVIIAKRIKVFGFGISPNLMKNLFSIIVCSGAC